MPCETLHHGVNSDKANFVKQRHVKNFILKRLSEVSFTIFVFSVLCFMLSYANFAMSSFMHVSYSVKRHFREKFYSH